MIITYGSEETRVVLERSDELKEKDLNRRLWGGGVEIQLRFLGIDKSGLTMMRA